MSARGGPLAAAVAALAAAAAPLPASAQQLELTRVRLDSAGAVVALARRGFEVAGIERVGDLDYAIVVTRATERLSLRVEGFAVTAVPEAPMTPVNFADFDGSPRGAVARLGLLAARNPRVRLDTIGSSVEGRVIIAVKVGPAGDAPERPNVLFVGTHHAREWIAAEMALRLIEYLADSLPASAEGASLLDRVDAWVIPVLNPDGYQHSFSGERLWRKNRRPNADGTFGVDLNRNYPAFFGIDDVGSSAIPGAETYRGTAPASEPETRALIAFHAAHPPVLAVSYHSYSDLVLYPYGHASGLLAPDGPAFQGLAGTTVAPALRDALPESARASYHPGPTWQLYPVNGEYTEWAYRTHGTLAFTVELTAGCCVAGRAYGFHFPDDAAAVARVVADNVPFALAVLDAAGRREPGSPAVFETLVPEIRAVGAGAAPVEVARLRMAGGERDVRLEADSLDRGVRFRRWRGDAGGMAAGRVTVRGLRLEADLLATAGAEPAEAGWTGWARDSTTRREGRFSWRATADTLRSPIVVTDGRPGVTVAFWTRHQGSLFTPARRGVLEYSTDGGRTWEVLSVVAGWAPAWYPVTAPVPGSPPSVRLRFSASDMPWWIDAVQVFAAAQPVAAAAAARAEAIAVSENPVRSGQVFLSWTAAPGRAVVSVFTFRGDLVYRTQVDGAAGRAAWDLTNAAGAPVSNGAYVVVVEAPGAVHRRRLFVARSP